MRSLLLARGVHHQAIMELGLSLADNRGGLQLTADTNPAKMSDSQTALRKRQVSARVQSWCHFILPGSLIVKRPASFSTGLPAADGSDVAVSRPHRAQTHAHAPAQLEQSA